LYNTNIKQYCLLFLLLFISASVGQENLKLCAIRVEFQTEENNLTTGDGRFMLDSSAVQPFTIDPPPHDRKYFRDQITAVANYFTAASDSRLTISGDVFPLEQTSVYELPYPMGYYNPNTTDEENNYFLARLFIDAIKAADKDNDFRFHDYDLITIFHAGVGNDIDLGFDETPQDIPSLYLTPDFLKKALGDTFGGIVVDNGQTIVEKGIILPETESQAGFELALTGIFAANIASYLGMYDLFSPSTKRPGIGRFGLMDSGLFNLFGLTPALPCAFSRQTMGWGQLSTLSAPENNLELHRLISGDNKGPDIIKIPINSDEYYLLEFRGDADVNIDSMFAVLSENREVPPTYLEVLMTYLPDRITISDSTGVLLAVEDYDWGLPGAGILIWHIDQQVINEKSALNAINDDRDNRAVDLEEADGSQDIGYEYSIIEPGFNSELGTWLDFWFDGNQAPLYKNEFSVRTAPNTRSNRNYSDSRIHLSGFSGNQGDLMTFDYQQNSWVEGFPLSLSREDSSVFSTPLAGPVDLSEKRIVMTSDSKGQIFGVTKEGKGLLQADQFLLAKLAVNQPTSLALGDSDQDGRNDRLIAAASEGDIQLYGFRDSDTDGLLDTIRTQETSESVSSGPVVQHPYFYIGTNSGKILRFLLTDGQLDSVYQFDSAVKAFTVIDPNDLRIEFSADANEVFAPVVIDLNSDGLYETIRIDQSGRIDIGFYDGTTEIKLEEPVLAPPSFGDLDGNGRYEILLTTEKKIYALNYNGSQVSNFPVKPVLYQGESLTGSVLIFDADASGQQDVLVVTTQGRILIVNLLGQIIDGFPVTSGAGLSCTPLTDDLDEDGRLEIYVLNDRGDLFAWQLDSSSDPQTIWWQQYAYSAERNTYIIRQLNPESPTIKDLMPAQSVYNYPNPNQSDYTTIRYFLKEAATVSIKIFDLAGDMVTSFNGPGAGNVYNEKRWNLSGIASGVYLCRVEAVSTSEKNVKIIKILVVN
jgi:M6 family metalloprotease-like protein